MSVWTHIVGSIDVDTFIEDDRVKEIVEEKLKVAPKITGSEKDAEIFVNVLGGHNVSTSCDCGRCDYGNTVTYPDEGGCTCKAPEDFKCPSGVYQRRVVITILGDLRDKWDDETEKEYKAFYDFVDKEFMIRNSSINITM